MFDSKYIYAEQMKLPQRKTKVYQIWSKKPDTLLGFLKWYGAWRQYCFFPCHATIWNSDCLTTVKGWLKKLNREHKRAKEAKP